MFMGIIFNILQYYCQLIYIIYSPISIICVMFLLYYTNCFFWFLFYAQHTWHLKMKNQNIVNLNWSEAQVKGCYSLWNSNLNSKFKNINNNNKNKKKY
mmetsp:Transcript_12661/g.16339  ORF Transcript_12661/g.16339 Transcript_12661/m.16339 type:complete len:98 (-) Transcript_12661:64-357(-)